MSELSLQSYFDYPESDGQPVAETEFHLMAILYLIGALKSFFAEREDAYVVGNMMFYYRESDPSKVISPDVFVVYGIDKHERRTYKLWEETKAPSIVFEITSGSTKNADIGSKRDYASLGVEEYYLIDVEKEYLPEPLQAYRLVNGHYELSPIEKPNSEKWKSFSSVLGLEIHVERRKDSYQPRLYDPKTNRWLLDTEEANNRALQLEQQLQAMQAELERLKQQIKTEN